MALGPGGIASYAASLLGGVAFAFTLIGAAPRMTRPPQSAGAREPTSFALVITIGAVAVPTALIFEPRVMTSAEVVSALIRVPGSIVSVAPDLTNNCLPDPSTYV